MSRAGRRLALLMALAGAVLLEMPRDARAHVRSASWSTWTVRGADVAVRVRLSRLDLSALARFASLAASPGIGAEDEGALAAYFTQRLRAETDAGPCAVIAGSYQPQGPGDAFVVRSWRARCATAEGLRVTSELLLEEVPSHLHFATLTRDGAPVAERLLAGEGRFWALGGAAVPTTSVLDFISLGARHVASGADHLIFVLALLVAASSLGGLAGVVTGFTIGHSATLALAVLGGVRPEVATIEALVGASIAVVAVENVWLEQRDRWLAASLCAGLGLIAVASSATGRGAPVALLGLLLFVACYLGLLRHSERPAYLRWTVAALFGAVHGFAFSGALAEMELPRERLAAALFGFNVGVELAQLAVIAAAWPLWRLVARTRAGPRALVLASSAALCAGTFWLVERTFG